MFGWGFFVAFTLLVFIGDFLLIRRAWVTHKTDNVKVKRPRPFVSILVPAYNEEVGIVDSINSLLQQNYPSFEVIVVNDGSTDNTYQVLCDNFGGHEMVTILNQLNAGKAEALNTAALNSTGNWLLCVDADTILDRDALDRIEAFRRPDADAVAPMIGIHNGMKMEPETGRPYYPEVPRKISTRVQWLEYVKSYVVYRCSFQSDSVTTVISGACGYISKQMWIKTGGWKKGQLGEDMELTMNIHALGGKVQFLPEVLAWTEAPNSIAELGKQRVRWFRGSLQALTLHRKLIFGKGNFKLKWIMLPYIWVSGIFGSWVEVAAWLYTAYLFLTNAPIDWLMWFFIWLFIMCAHYINSIMTIRFVDKKLGVDYSGYKRGYFTSIVEGTTYHFLYLYWLVKAHLQQIFKTKKKWNKLKRRGVKN